MNYTKILSVIIPSYNMEEFLDECIESMTRSKFIDDVEIIVVNDGSTDSTSEIAHGWEKKFPDSVYVCDKENGGHGSAINYGAYVCAGKYFKVIDADDWVDTDAFDKLIEKLKGTDADCVICNYMQVYETSGNEEVYDCIGGFASGVSIPLGEYVSKYNIRLHSATFKTSIYRSSGIKVREKCFFDDAQYCLYAYGVIKNVECYELTVYQYRLQRAGQSVSPQGFLKHLDDHRKVVIDLCRFAKILDVKTVGRDVEHSLIETIGNHIQLQYSFISKYGTKDQLRQTKQFDAVIKIEYPEIYRNMKIERGGRVLKFLHFGHYGLLKIFRKIFVKANKT